MTTLKRDKRSINSAVGKLPGGKISWNEDNVLVTTDRLAFQADAGDEDCTKEDGETFDALNAAVLAVGWAQEATGLLVDAKKGIKLFRAGSDDADFVAMDKAGEELARDPELQDLMTTLSEGGEDEEGDEESTGSVVPSKFKERYKVQSERKVDCGDWLADQMAHFVVVPVVEGKKKTMTDLDRFEDICTSNGVDAKKMAALRTGTPGWQGRFRMTGRNLLTPLVATKGVLFVPHGFNAKEDTELKAPRQWCLDNAPKAKAEPKAKKAAIPAAKGKGKASKEAKPAKAKKAKKETALAAI